MGHGIVSNAAPPSLCMLAVVEGTCGGSIHLAQRGATQNKHPELAAPTFVFNLELPSSDIELRGSFRCGLVVNLVNSTCWDWRNGADRPPALGN